VQTLLSSMALLTLAALSCGGGHSATQSGGILPSLSNSWTFYAQTFIQADGRVIDRSAGGSSTSEGQSYAMLRAVWIGDRSTFDKSYSWGRNNLNSQVRQDHLWAWKWGKAGDGGWRVLDKAFASDADQDVALALITAFKTWRDDRYLQEARAILADIWNEATLQVGDHRFLLAGDSLCSGANCRINPSYYAPYAYRIFAKFDKAHDWGQLVDTTYFVLTSASALTETALPPDWLVLDTRTGRLSLPSDKGRNFSYDALRVYWRIAMDRALSQDSRADEYLRRTLPWLIATRRKRGELPAVISPSGAGLASYESLEMIAAVLPAIDVVDSSVAQEMAHQLESAYRAGAWGDRNSYYLQNWAWFGTALYTHYLSTLRTL
jgi:endoglucanase